MQAKEYKCGTYSTSNTQIKWSGRARSRYTMGYDKVRVPQKGKQKSPNELFFNKKKDRVQVKHFMEWGRFGFITDKGNKNTKFKARGTPMMFVGYCLEHPSGTYKFYNADKHIIVRSDSGKWSTFKKCEVTSEKIGQLKELTYEDITHDVDKEAQPEITVNEKRVTRSMTKNIEIKS